MEAKTKARILTARYLLQIGFFGIFSLMGIDKYFNYFEKNWVDQIAPVFMRMLGNYAHLYMWLIGACEIAAAFGILIKPKYFGFILGWWLILIVINLGISGHNLDDLIRDAGLSMAAFALGFLSFKLPS